MLGHLKGQLDTHVTVTGVLISPKMGCTHLARYPRASRSLAVPRIRNSQTRPPEPDRGCIVFPEINGLRREELRGLLSCSYDYAWGCFSTFAPKTVHDSGRKGGVWCEARGVLCVPRANAN
jgi:hypothetical protein